MEPLLTVEPDAEYRAKEADYLTSHRLAEFRECPLVFHLQETGAIPPRADTPAYQFGRMAHTLVLEGADAFDQRYLVNDGPINPKTDKPYGRETKTFSSWAAGLSKPAISTEDYRMLAEMTACVRTHPAAGPLLEEGQAEGVVREEWAGCKCQSRIDWYGPGGLVDLKTCEDLAWFERDIKKYGYTFQLAFYWKMLLLSLGEAAAVHIVAVEKQVPYRCGVWQIPQGLLEDAAEHNERSILKLLDCRKSGNWPSGYEEVRILREW